MYLAMQRTLSNRDRLTGLLSRKGFLRAAAKKLKYLCRKNYPVTIVYLDVDEFAAFNSRFGSQQGDLLLVLLAGALHKFCRKTSLLGRLGSDQFAILLPSTGPEAAIAIVHRLREAIDRTIYIFEPPPTTGIGALTFLVCPDSIESMIHSAEASVRKLKQSQKGGNVHCVVDA